MVVALVVMPGEGNRDVRWIRFVVARGNERKIRGVAGSELHYEGKTNEKILEL